jgi:biopolymer transport protein ExbB
MDAWYAVAKFFEDGGFFMYPILVVLALGAAIAIERYVTLTRMTKRNQRSWSKLHQLIVAGDFDQAREIASKDDSTIARILSMGLARQGAVRRREDVEQAMEESLIEILPQLEKRTHYLATFANMSTLAGLLGTIIGLIDAFTAVSNADLADKAQLLSSSISIGMNCTAFGLMVAIPLVLIHSMLQTKTTAIVDSLEMASVKFLNAITERANYAKRVTARIGADYAASATAGPIAA